MRTNNVAVDKAESLTNMKNAALSEKLFITSAAPSRDYFVRSPVTNDI